MKKIVRGILLGLLAVVIIAGSVTAYFLFQSGKPKVSNYPYVVDNEGSSYLAVEGKDGVTYAVVTDAAGNRYAAQINGDGSIGSTLGNVNEQVSLEDLPTNYTGEKIDESINPNDFTGNASDLPDSPDVTPATAPDDSTSVTQPSENSPTQSTQNAQSSTQVGTQAGTQNTQNTQSSQSGNQNTTASNNGSTSPAKPTDPATQPSATKPDKLTAYRIEKYQKIFENGTYLMEFKTNDPELGETPITAAMKNGNFIIDTKIQNYSCRMLYLAKDKTTYLIIDDFKKYTKLPEDLMGEEDFDMTSMMSSFATSDVPKQDIKVKEVELGGKKLICESYKLEDGSEARFYFDGETLVRRDNVNPDGTTDSTYISRITSDVPDSMFEIPKNYGFLNLSWLGALAG